LSDKALSGGSLMLDPDDERAQDRDPVRGLRPTPQR
jgi:hypothetical protein